MNNNETQMASLALRLLERVDLKGSEVPAFVAISNWLNSKIPAESAGGDLVEEPELPLNKE